MQVPIKQLLVLQKRALRLIYFKQIRDHVVPLFIDSNVLPISFIHFYRLCNIMWDVTNNVAPSNIGYSFLKTTDVHHYATRSSTKDDFYVEHSKLQKVRNSFLRTGPKVWNALHSEFRNLSKFTFQKKLKHRLGSFRTLFFPNLLTVLSDNNTLLSHTYYRKLNKPVRFLLCIP